jgi:hypothetical protein
VLQQGTACVRWIDIGAQVEAGGDGLGEQYL